MKLEIEGKMHVKCNALLEDANWSAIQSRVYIPDNLISEIEEVNQYSIRVGNGAKYFLSACCIERALADYIFVLIDDAELKHIQG